VLHPTLREARPHIGSGPAVTHRRRNVIDELVIQAGGGLHSIQCHRLDRVDEHRDGGLQTVQGGGVSCGNAGLTPTAELR
jgi:hypothetical protein